ncbi:MAG: hypothetical protein ACIAXF_02300 [Phycisphaerales bacterium JB063]
MPYHPSNDERIRILNLLARLRSRQLDLALRGKVADSARYAHRASRVRRYSQQQLVEQVAC